MSRRRDPRQLELFLEETSERPNPPPEPKVEGALSKRRGRLRLIALDAAERPRNRHREAKPGRA
jgi:hypothetical protein